MRKSKPVEKKGVLYLGHLPFGFYGAALWKYFKQFGQIKKVRVEKSNKTGRYKGYGFIEFANEEVAKIAAEATHNYVMNRKVLKAKFIPADDMKGALRKKKKVYPYQRKSVRRTTLCAAIGLSERALTKKQANYLKLHEKLVDYGVTNYDLLPVNLDNLEKRIEESKGRKERLNQLRQTAKENLRKSMMQENVVTRILRGRKSQAAKFKAKAKRMQKNSRKRAKAKVKKPRVIKKRVKKRVPKKKVQPMKPMNKKIDTFERALDNLRESLNKSTAETPCRTGTPTVRTEKQSGTKSSAVKYYKTETDDQIETDIVKSSKRKHEEVKDEHEKREEEPKSKQKETSNGDIVNTSKDPATAPKAPSGKDRLKSFRHKVRNIHYKYIS